MGLMCVSMPPIVGSRDLVSIDDAIIVNEFVRKTENQLDSGRRTHEDPTPNSDFCQSHRKKLQPTTLTVHSASERYRRRMRFLLLLLASCQIVGASEK